MPPTRRRLLIAGSLGLAGCASPRGTQPLRRDTVALLDVPTVEWQEASPERHGIPAPTLTAVLDDGVKVEGLRGMVVVRDGFLLGERYYAGAEPDDLQPINSVTKSVTSMLVGKALERGTLRGRLDATVRELLPDAIRKNPDSALGGLTLRAILAGRSGFAWDIFDSSDLANAPDPVAVALGQPRGVPPPSGWTYNDPVVGLVGPILAEAEGTSLAMLAARDLFAPLGIGRYSWRRDRQRRPLAYGGLALRPRDLAKLAWTMCDGGKWRGQQVLPADWVAESTTRHGPADWRVAPVDDVGYGYLWFTGAIGARRVVWGWGYGGQFALFVPEHRLAIATAATSPRRAQLRAQTDAVMQLVARVVEAAKA
ncbi:serine hydrolase domain-containing protein [Piscinibacter koreensis]|uniref:Serine hydrolase n=1 Tax=Piscinibacter koreensis TaxID=2742824 RepID=A0A7Y6NKJ7_9BURK|nr:serine hydrolase [Schlegelella koreensis]NUZ04845.1 serine hydrolase [Schlegelella koreensis]